MNDPELHERILTVLDSDAPLDSVEIANHVDRHPVAVDQSCAHLHDQGLIYASGAGRYRLTEKGQEVPSSD